MNHDYLLRPAPHEDIAEVLAVSQAVDRATVGETMLDPDDLDGLWRDPTFDPESDSLLVTHGGRPVAFGAVFQDTYARIAVLPEHRGRGIGTSLARWAEARQRQRGLDRCQQEAFAGDAQTIALLQARGYQHVYDSWLLELPSDATITQRGLPPGIEVRPMRAGEERAVHAVIEEAFGEWEHRAGRSFESWAALLLDRPGMTEDHLLVATHGGEVVGACVGMDGERDDEIWVAQLAVRRSHRGQGIAQQLLAVAYGRARERGLPRGRLETDSRTGALTLYERLGMRVTLAFRNYRLDLTRD
ncbi:GNAT family N-acetyltransferase [Aeromicrobium massiliense]|uniref:GNAT family N-acetyltransferase n=1 Tax=Aeromicrobium massiliense TaxID=1464554 RepID=UPI0002D46CEA|nr:GNAT family N-acetyltransferase [Aeromicrobium massiliense]